MKIGTYSTGWWLLAAVCCLASCTKEDDYKKYTAEGEITYPGKVDSVIVHSGNGRALLDIALGSDPAVTLVRAYWNDGADSAELPVVRAQGQDTVYLMIEDLNEGQYNFQIYTYDRKNNKSVMKNAAGTVYGDNYLKAISNRSIRSLKRSNDGNSVFVDWTSPLAGESGIDLKYTDQDGVERSVTIPAGEAITELPYYEPESELRYRSLFLPEPDAIDTFYIDYTRVTLPAFERVLPKEDFKIVILPTDVVEGGYGWLMDYLWNENYNPPGFATQNSDSQWFTFDSGVSGKPSRMKIWQANDRLYKDQNVRKFEIWGSNDPAADGSWGSWTLLMTCESVKPSGLPLGELSDADITYANAGEEFIFPEDTPEVRYFRIKVLETWDSTQQFITIAELTFWTRQRL